MTGYGKAMRALDGDVLTVEVNAVNHRYLDCVVHMPPAWSALEGVVKERLRARVSRGRFNVWIARKRGGRLSQSVNLDAGVARQYVAAAEALGALLEQPGALSLDVLAQLDGVFYLEEPEEELDTVQATLLEALTAALDALNGMRATEGAALDAEARRLIAAIGEGLERVEERLPQLDATYRERLRTRLAELGVATDVADERVAVELALLADKGDVTEEVVRLRTHMNHALELLQGQEPKGRELNFLSQEMQREVNTLSSKVRDGAVTRDVLRMKSDIEKFREQVQNIE